MTTDTQRSYIGVGKVLARVFGSTGRWRHVGNVSKLDLSHKLDTKRQRDHTRAGGGTLVKVSRIDQVELGMTWLSFSPENYALALAGTLAAVPLGTTAAEVVKGYKGSTLPLAHPPSVITTVKDSATSLITYVAGTDYEMSPSGLYIPDSSSIVDAADLLVAYAHAAYSRVEAAMGTSSLLELLFEGLNEADSNKAAIVNIWKADVPSADQVALIGDDLGKFDFKAECLKDSTKGAGVSAFYRALLS